MNYKQIIAKLKEDINTSNTDSLIGKKIIKKKKKDNTESVTNDFNGFPMDEFHKGIIIESEEHKNIDIIEVAKLVLDHLKEDQNFYSKED